MTNPATRSVQRRSRSSRMLAMFVLLSSCGGCVSGRHLAPQQGSSPSFDPATFFSGTTAGTAVLKIVMHRPERVLVAGQGHSDADGTLVLDQSVRSDNGPAKRRSWHLRRNGPERWTGTLSDAAGPVDGQVIGDCLHLAFAMKGGLKAQQWLYLQPGGNIVRNIMVVRKFGLPVARLDETISRQPPPSP